MPDEKSRIACALVPEMCFNPALLLGRMKHFDTFPADRFLRLRVNPLAAIAALAVIIVVTLAFGASAIADSLRPVVKTQTGEVRGITNDGVSQFLGVPYAAPPVGELRWQPPTPHAKWSGIFEASRAGNSCAQMRFQRPGMQGSEDCLFLNIYAPSPAGRRLPVMVWIHGGTFIGGAGAWYHGNKLAARGNLIVVTINYRLGAFGFLANRSLDSTDVRHLSGNYGLLDQQAALRWIRDNIKGFGGDPHRVTVAGQSAGAISIGLHIVSPAAAGLFARAILESGPFLGPLHHTRTLAEAEARGDNFAAKLGCDKASDVAACLRAKTTTEVLAAIPANLLEAGDLPWAPVVDGHLIPMQPADAIAAGHFNKVAVINGSDRDEGTLFTAFDKPLSADQYVQAVNARAGSNAPRVLAAYPQAGYGSPAQAAAAALGDLTFSCRILKASELLAAAMPVYQYQFGDAQAPNKSYPKPVFPLGAYHGAEIQYVLGNIVSDAAVSPAQRQLSDAMMDYWIRFVTSGSPGGSPAWPRFRMDDPKVLSLAPGAIDSKSDFAKAHHCELWDSMAR
jgi:para-nitrobenzyl esterase